MKNYFTLFTLAFCTIMGGNLWSQTQVGSDIVNPNSGTTFGRSVWMSGDGNRFATSGYSSGIGGYTQVYELFDTVWIQVGNDMPGVSGFFEADEVCISADGNRVAQAYLFPENETGTVQVFEFQGGEWVQMGSNLNGVNQEFARFGNSIGLSADGSRLVVGAQGNMSTVDSSRAFVYEWSELDTNWVQIGAFNSIPNPPIASAVAISDDGNRVGISDSNFPNSRTQIYEWQNDSWVALGDGVPAQTVKPLVMSADGNRIASATTLVNEPESYVAIYEWDNGAWVQVGDNILFDVISTKRSVDLSADGNRIALGGPIYNGDVIGSSGEQPGQARLYELVNDSWVLVGSAINGFDDEGMGRSVNLSADGNRMAVGARSAGLVRVFDFSTVSNTTNIGGLEVTVFPNPTTDFVQIKGITPDLVYVLDQNGRLVNTVNNGSSEVGLENLPAGIYFLHINADNNWGLVKIVKE